MGKPTGFLEFQREENKAITPKERIKHFNEFHHFMNEKERAEQGARCMNCGVPFCQSAINLKGMVTGCPLHNLIPEWNDAIFQKTPNHGVERLLKTNIFPEFTGRVCPALCEKACICGMDDGEAVTIHENELYLIEHAFKTGFMKPRQVPIRSDKKVAIIGSGPAGLAAADCLNQRGHQVTIYERDDRFGGLLMYGIPNMKLEKGIIDRRIELMKAEGIQFISNTNVGVDISKEEILQTHDAIILATGAKKARTLSLKNCDAQGVYLAVDFLSATTKSLIESNLEDNNFVSAKGKNVVVVGGGDTGNDCVGTAIRHGANSVIQIEIMPKPPTKRADSNPWPEWPNILKTDYGQEEAIAVFGKDPRLYSTTVKEIISTKGKLEAIVTVEVMFKDGKMIEVKDSEQTIKADLLLLAMGFLGTEEYLFNSFGVQATERSNIATPTAPYTTSIDKIFTAGDARRGQSLVVWAIKEGKECAKVVDQALMGYSNMS